jgi:dihydrofolate synthase/folylpolyglutamate synthase
VGMLGSKDCEGFLKNFAGLARRVIAIPIANQANALPSETIAAAARAVGIPADGAADVEGALAAIAGLELSSPPRVLITGSLYLAGEVLAANGTPPI